MANPSEQIVMSIFSQIYQVKDKQIVVTLPDDFVGTEVEVWVRPRAVVGLGEKGGDTAVVQAILNKETSNLLPDQQELYQRLQAYLQAPPSARPPVAGLFAGLIHTAPDFDDPLPDEHLFWGETTDEYGLSLPSPSTP
jgi:hypothetical protein